MGKFEDYGILAEKYYVEDQKTIADISKLLNVPKTTLRRWRDNQNWDYKRRMFLSSQYSCFLALQELLLHLSKDALEKIKSGEIPESASLNFIAKMSEKLPKIKENAMTTEGFDKLDKTSLSEIAKLIDKRLMNG